MLVGAEHFEIAWNSLLQIVHFHFLPFKSADQSFSFLNIDDIAVVLNFTVKSYKLIKGTQLVLRGDLSS